jgi:hypothetical protein
MFVHTAYARWRSALEGRKACSPCTLDQTVLACRKGAVSMTACTEVQHLTRPARLSSVEAASLTDWGPYTVLIPGPFNLQPAAFSTCIAVKLEAHAPCCIIQALQHKQVHANRAGSALITAT